MWLKYFRRKGNGAADGPEQAGPGVAVSADEGFPNVSVIVAARNEEKSLPSLLDSLSRQDYPADLLEIIIVNDNSTDRTPIVASEFIAGLSGRTAPRIKLIYNPFSGKKRAVRYGIEKAAGEVILTTDADCTVGPEWVRRHASWYRGSGTESVRQDAGPDCEPGDASIRANAGPDSEPADPSLRANAGPESARGDAWPEPACRHGSGNGYLRPSMVLAGVIQKPTGGFWSHFGVFEFSALQAITEAAAVAGHPVMCNGANMSFLRDVYLRHAGQLRDDIASGDDMFLLHAVMADGGVVSYDGSRAAAAETAAAVTAAALLRQRARWASKALHLRSTPTLTLAAATAACNAAVAAAAVAAIVWTKFIPLAAAMYVIKAVPDYLLVSSEMRKRGIKMATGMFLVSEVIYPFYFIVVGVMSRLPGAGRFHGR